MEGLRIELVHSATGCVGLQSDPSHWAHDGQNELNPRTLAACWPLLAQEERLVAVIPVGAQTPLPMGLRVRFSTEQTALVEEHLCLDQQALAPVERLDFGAGAGPELILAEVS